MTESRAARGDRWLARAAALRARIEPALPVLRVLTFVVAVGIVVVMAAGAVGDVDGATCRCGRCRWRSWESCSGGCCLRAGWSILASGRIDAGDVATWCRTQTLRYLPGGVWAPASRATVLRGRILDRISTVAAENVIAL